MIVEKSKWKDVAKKIDDKVDWVKITGKKLFGNILEIGDDFILPQGLIYLDNNFSDKVPERFHDNLNDLADAFLADDKEAMLAVIPETLDEIGDIKALDDTLEHQFITVNFEAAVKFLEYYAKKE